MDNLWVIYDCWLVTGTWILFSHINWENNHPNWLIFFRGVCETTNQLRLERNGYVNWYDIIMIKGKWILNDIGWCWNDNEGIDIWFKLEYTCIFHFILCIFWLVNYRNNFYWNCIEFIFDSVCIYEYNLLKYTEMSIKWISIKWEYMTNYLIITNLNEYIYI